jgi:hypothetical protein
VVIHRINDILGILGIRDIARAHAHFHRVDNRVYRVIQVTLIR